ncbi:putative Mg2+ transporter protein, CorA-like/Zinc transport protein ZntB [Rosa chinensis]|uniref:Magnesium transporter n=1 Tax=Rosa chinensis TaxID=74649 RepID=A0A2P6PVL1_ROSCH|nr:magnesium transporter MRS2-I [Rosa chinensis]PRQ25959.1 putative Mg2+ transporter protein, CorA-like/Zinc transport protein ZntB [Rosa chinensis]
MIALEMARDGSLVNLETQAQANKKTAALRSWISLDQDGQGTVLDLDKYAIMRRVNIHARDLRLLDPLLSYPSTILGREKVIVLNLEHIKAIITAEEVLLRDPFDDNVLPIVEELQRRLPPTSANFNGPGEEEDSGLQKDVETSEDDDFPFEFRALEVALEAICTSLDACTRELESDAYPALDELTSKISSRNLDRVRKLKSAMTRLTNRVQKVRDELEQLLDDDDDMADLYLSRKLVGTSPVSDSGAPNWSLASPTITIGSKVSRASRASVTTVQEENDVEELEMLLEAYFMQIEGTLNKLTTLREYIDDTEDYINIQLDNHRNQLIQLELFLSSGTVCVSIYSLVAAIFGMNIKYTWNENHEHVFKWVVITTGLVGASIFLFIVSYARHKGLVGS